MKEIVDARSMDRSLVRMAHEIIEKNKGPENIVLVGIKTRGEFIAKRLKANIEKFENIDVPCASIDITFWRDDIKADKTNKHVLDINVEGKIVILVDDVLYSGRTVRAAMDGILQNARAKEIHLAVLVDRGHRELPIRADYVGKNIPTSHEEKVLVRISEFDKMDGVFID